MQTKPIDEIIKAVRELSLPGNIDLVVGIARGGIVPASMIASCFDLDLELLWLNFRGPDQKPQRIEPTLVKPMAFEPGGRHILLVDDRSKTGSTLGVARKMLDLAASVTTLCVNGKADISLFDEDCFRFPWRVD